MKISEQKVTVYFFRSSGKWYTTEDCLWSVEADELLIGGDWRGAVRSILPKDRLTDMRAVVIDSPLGFPAMVESVEKQ